MTTVCELHWYNLIINWFVDKTNTEYVVRLLFKLVTHSDDEPNVECLQVDNVFNDILVKWIQSECPLTYSSMTNDLIMIEDNIKKQTNQA